MDIIGFGVAVLFGVLTVIATILGVKAWKLAKREAELRRRERMPNVQVSVDPITLDTITRFDDNLSKLGAVLPPRPLTRWQKIKQRIRRLGRKNV